MAVPAPTYDVIIVGARVAGASLALLVGRRGRRVLLVDRDHFPSSTLSTHFLTPVAIDALARLGALADVEATGARRMRRSRAHVEECVLAGPIVIAPAPGSYALCVGREQLDAILIQRARQEPTVSFMERTRVEGLLREGERVHGVRLRGPDDTLHDVQARVVIGADRKYSKVAS